MGLHAHGGTPRLGHNQGLSLAACPNPRAEDRYEGSGGAAGDYHWGEIQKLGACDLGLHSSLVALLGKENLGGSIDPPAQDERSNSLVLSYFSHVSPMWKVEQSS